jgi:hypothetical protein
LPPQSGECDQSLASTSTDQSETPTNADAPTLDAESDDRRKKLDKLHKEGV